MDTTFFPSEIARLVLGYLKEDKCLKSWQTFLEESSNLREYSTLFKRGKVYSTNVNGCSLLDILNEYCILKFQAINKDPKTECFSSKSEIIGTLKEDDFIESTKHIVDSVFQNYLSPSDNSRGNVSTNSSSDAFELPKYNNCGSKETKKHCTDAAENLSVIKSYHQFDEQNATFSKNNVNNRNKSYEEDKTQRYQSNKKLNLELDTVKKGNNQLYQSVKTHKKKGFSNSNDYSESLTSFIQSLSDQLSRKVNPTVNLPDVVQHRQNLKNNNLSLSKSKLSHEENAVSSTEIADDDIEIIEEIITKEKKSSDNPNSKDGVSCSNNMSANQKAIDNIVEENSQINVPRHEINSSDISNVEVLQTNSLKDIRTEQTYANDQNNINVTDSSNNQVSYVDSATFMQPTVAGNEMSFSYPQNYILPNYAPSSSFTNNAPVYVVLNTPGASSRPIINGTFLTMPTVQTNTAPCPISPAVSTAFVNNSITAPMNNFSNPFPATNTVSNVDEISVPSLSENSPQNSILTAPPVDLSNSLEKKTNLKTKVDNKVLKSSLKTYSKESQSPKVSKRKCSHKKKDQKKKKDCLLPKDQLIPTPEAGILSLIDFKGEHSNKSKSKISSNSCPSKIQKATKRKRSKEKKDKKCKKNKISDKSPPPIKVKIAKPKWTTPCFQSFLEEQDFSQHDEIGHHLNSSNIIPKTNREVNDCTKSISTFSNSQNNFNNSTLINSSLPGVEENRVLKVVLSDIFVDIHHKIDSFQDQGSDSNTEFSMQEKS